MKSAVKWPFIFISIFFYSSMVILYINLSSVMYYNATIKSIKKEINSFQSTLQSNRSLTSLTEIESIVNSTEEKYFAFYTIYTSDKEVLSGSDDIRVVGYIDSVIDLNPEEAYFKILDDNFIFSAFSLQISDSTPIYLSLCYNISSVSTLLFPQANSILMIIVLLPLFIGLFLIIMILNLYKRVNIREKQNAQIATLDPLTGFYNKEYFFKVLKNEIDRINRNSGIVSLIVCDMNNFFSIYEKYGYDFAELIIQAVAKIIENNYRNYDIIGRFGDDEFVILMVDSSGTEALESSERCSKMIEDSKFYYESTEITITASFGISSFEGDPKGDYSNENAFRELTFSALKALSSAKKSSDKKVVVYNKE